MTGKMKMKAVKVEWIDSCASNYSWTLIKELDGDFQPIRIITYGVLIHKEKDFICVAQNYGLQPKQVCSLMTIPRGCITSITELEELK